MIVYTENSKESVKKWLELINRLSQVADYKGTTQKSVVFLYTSKEQSKSERNELQCALFQTVFPDF